MKNYYFTVFTLIMGLCLVNQAYSQLAADNLAIYRYGNGAITNNTAPVFIDEYTQDGAFIQSISFPVSNASGNYALTGLPFTASAIPIEGLITLSGDRNYLSVVGYNTGVGQATGQVGRVIGIIGADGVVNTSTCLTGDRGSPRAAVIGGAGAGVWFATTGTTGVDNSAGLKYVASGTTIANAVRISSDNSQYRSVLEFGGDLYSTRGNNSFYKIEAMPVSGSNSASVHALPGSTAISQIVLFDTNNDTKPDLLYAADDSSTGIVRKYISEDAGATWVAKGTTTDDGVTNGIKSITGKMISGVVTLYMTTTGVFGNTEIKSSLFKVVDNNPLTAELNADDNAPEVLKIAPDGTMFRGVAFTPGSTILPVELLSFKASSKGSHVDLSWVTVSEKNNSHFEVLRAEGTNHFHKIGSVKGNGNSKKENVYHFSDLRPENGINYYKLNQVDYNGESKETDVVSIFMDFDDQNIKIIGSKSEILVTVEGDLMGEGYFKVLSVEGKELITHKVKSYEPGYSFSLPHSLPAGIYIGILVGENQNIKRVKFYLE